MIWMQLHRSPSNYNWYNPITDRWERNNENCDTVYWTDSGRNFLTAMYPGEDPNDFDSVEYVRFSDLNFADADDFVEWMYQEQ